MSLQKSAVIGTSRNPKRGRPAEGRASFLAANPPNAPAMYPRSRLARARARPENTLRQYYIEDCSPPTSGNMTFLLRLLGYDRRSGVLYSGAVGARVFSGVSARGFRKAPSRRPTYPIRPRRCEPPLRPAIAADDLRSATLLFRPWRRPLEIRTNLN